MTWLSGFFNSNNNLNTAPNEPTNKEVYFQVVNKSATEVSVKLFQERPETIQEDDDSDSCCSLDSEYLNGHEPISFCRPLPVGERFFYRSTTCPFADNHVGTVAVESEDKTYYVDAHEVLTLPEGKDPSSFITSESQQLDDPLGSSSSSSKKEQDEELKAQVIHTDDLIVVKLALSCGDEKVDEGSKQALETYGQRMSHWALDADISTLEASINTAMSTRRRPAQVLESTALADDRREKEKSLRRQRSLKRNEKLEKSESSPRMARRSALQEEDPNKKKKSRPQERLPRQDSGRRVQWSRMARRSATTSIPELKVLAKTKSVAKTTSNDSSKSTTTTSNVVMARRSAATSIPALKELRRGHSAHRVAAKSSTSDNDSSNRAVRRSAATSIETLKPKKKTSSNKERKETEQEGEKKMARRKAADPSIAAAWAA